MASVAEIMSRDGRKSPTTDRAEGTRSPIAPASVEVAPGIFRTPGVCGGDACVGSTRITVWNLEAGRRLGTSDADTLAGFPGLSQADLDNAWAYVEAHREEVDRDIRENEEEPIVKTAGICFGAARIAGTRVPVWVLESYRRFGNTDAELLEDYPTITAADLQAAWDYADSHREEMNEAIRRNEED